MRRPSHTKIIAASLLYSTLILADVCSPNTCIKGSSSSPLLIEDVKSGNSLSPGTYPADSFQLSSLNAPPNISLSLTNDKLIVYPVSYPVVFRDSLYQSRAEGGTGKWQSAFFPEGWYGLVTPGQAVWGPIPSKKEIQWDPSKRNDQFLSIAYSLCNSPCGSKGTCTLQSNNNSSTGTCTCAPGWSGPSCDICSPSHWGPQCTPCPGNCTICDEGLAGTGICLGTSTNSLLKCDCQHGTCASDGGCLCAAGWMTNSTVSSQKCNSCREGSFQDTLGNCLACPLGCSTCSLQPGSNSTATCTSCRSSLNLSTSTPATCVSSQSCAPNQFWDSDTSSCQACSPACASCTGPSPSQCLSCANPRINLAGSCVGFEASTGICDSSLSGLSGVYVVNNAKSLCEACPVGCTTCSTPGFSSTSSFDSITCGACQDGYLLQAGSCVKSCSEGFYLPPGAGTNGTCQACDKSCTACITSPTTCTRCPSGSVAFNGQCTSSCPYRSLAANGTCLPCSGDCATCSAPLSPTSCLTCPPDRPALVDGRCMDHCPKSTFLSSAGDGACIPCAGNCTSCIGSATSCTGCAEGQILRSGSCVPAPGTKCAFAPGMGVCLEALLEKDQSKYFAFIALPIGLIAVGLVGWWWIRRERRKTREASEEFQDVLAARTRMGKVMGMERVQRQAAPTSDSQVKGKGRLRDLLLLSKSKRQDLDDMPLTDLSVHNKHLEANLSLTTGAQAAPPPPYTSSSGRQSTASIATVDLQSMTRAQFAQTPASKIVNLATPISPGAPDFGLRPPPRQVKLPSEIMGRRDTVRFGDQTGIPGRGAVPGVFVLENDEESIRGDQRRSEGWV